VRRGRIAHPMNTKARDEPGLLAGASYPLQHPFFQSRLSDSALRDYMALLRQESMFVANDKFCPFAGLIPYAEKAKAPRIAAGAFSMRCHPGGSRGGCKGGRWGGYEGGSMRSI